jgi:predicted deacylase
MRWEVNPSVVWVESDGQVQLYDTTAGEFQTLNPTAAAIWRHVAQQREQADITAALCQEFGAQDDNQRHLIEADTDAFVRHLADRGLIVPEPSHTG